MPRPSKPAPVTAALPNQGALLVLERACEDAASAWNEVSQASRLDYEFKAAVVRERSANGGFNFHELTPASRKLYIAAMKWTLRREVRAILKAAKKLQKNGTTGKDLWAVRQQMFAAKLEEARPLLAELEHFAKVDCKKTTGYDRKQASHKQRPATDDELEKFDKWAAKNSSFREAFLVAEFAGARGQEFEKGIRVQAVKAGGVTVLRFHIESAKCDGNKKGLDLRCVEVPFPAEAAKSVRRRWLALAQLAAVRPAGHVVSIEKTGKSTVGRRFTDACQTVSKNAGVEVAAYSFRNRFSAQTKAASKGMPDAAVNVALALGHQTTETQRHYARALRGKGGISPVSVRGVNAMGVQIRGPSERAGPPLHIRQRVALQGAVRTVAPPAAAVAARRRL